MATLERIRSKAGILVAAVIGLSLLAFVIQDFFDSRTSLFKGNSTDVGEINGKSITAKEMEAKIDELTKVYQSTRNQNPEGEELENIKNEAWKSFIVENILNKEFEKIGLAVGDVELDDLIRGVNPHPAVQQFFTNKNGQFDRKMLDQFLTYLKNKGEDQVTPPAFISLENQIISDRLQSKYVSLIRNGLTTPVFLAKNNYEEKNKKVDFSYIFENYDQIPDSAIKVTNSDLKKYYKDHIYLYDQQTEARNLEYITFDIVASNADFDSIKSKITLSKKLLENSNMADTVVNQMSDQPYIDLNYKKEELPDSLKKFVESAKIGAVYGPYRESDKMYPDNMKKGSFITAKLLKEVNTPDSIKVSRIIIQRGETPDAVAKSKKLVDSLRLLINKGTSFAEVARRFSIDSASGAKGGDLGWVQERMAHQDTIISALFKLAKDEVKVTDLEQEKYFVLWQVTDRTKEIKKYKLAIVENKILPSQGTIEGIRAKVRRFAGENNTPEKFNEGVKKQNLIKWPITISEGQRASYTQFDADRYINNESKIRFMQWAFSNDEGTVSEPMEMNSCFIVAVLNQIREKGTLPLEQVKDIVMVGAKRQKKTEKLIEKMNSARNGVSQINDLAAKLSLQVNEAKEISFASRNNDPKVIAAAVSMPKGKLSEPIEGVMGVFVITVNNISEVPAKDYKATINELNYGLYGRINDAFSALYKLAEVKDKRLMFNY